MLHQRKKIAQYYCLPNIVSRFFKLDLRPLALGSSSKIGYGIKYKILDDVLRFSGFVNRDMKDKTIVVQVMNKRGKILKELWIRGVESGSEQESLIELSRMTSYREEVRRAATIL